MVATPDTLFPKDHLMNTLETLLGYTFKDKTLLQQALTHSSASKNKSSYERLEFLGDRVLSLVIADMLFHAFPQEKEGALAKRHSTLVKQGALENVAKTLDLANIMHFARRLTQEQPSPSMQADVVEALIAAVYLDGGFSAADHFIRTRWQDFLQESATPPEDAKSALQEWAQGKALALPSYTVLEQAGPDHNPTFTVNVSVEGFAPQQATSSSKQAAQKLAAKMLLDIVRADTKKPKGKTS